MRAFRREGHDGSTARLVGRASPGDRRAGKRAGPLESGGLPS